MKLQTINPTSYNLKKRPKPIYPLRKNKLKKKKCVSFADLDIQNDNVSLNSDIKFKADNRSYHSYENLTTNPGKPPNFFNRQHIHQPPPKTHFSYDNLLIGTSDN